MLKGRWLAAGLIAAVLAVILIGCQVTKGTGSGRAVNARFEAIFESNFNNNCNPGTQPVGVKPKGTGQVVRTDKGDATITWGELTDHTVEFTADDATFANMGMIHKGDYNYAFSLPADMSGHVTVTFGSDFDPLVMSDKDTAIFFCFANKHEVEVGDV